MLREWTDMPDEINTDKPNPTFEIVLARQYDMQILADTIITAVEGGIGYWCSVVAYTHTEGPEHTRATIMIEDSLADDEEKGDTFTIDCEVARKGIERILNGSIELNSEMVGWIVQSLDEGSAFMIDADVADAIVQAGLLGEVRFG